jgi:hypothetical protein
LNRPEISKRGSITAIELGSQNSVSQELWEKPFIKKKLEPFLIELERMSDTLHVSLQELLGLITSEEIPNYSPFSDITVEEAWMTLKAQYEFIYKDIHEIYHNLNIKENRLVALSKMHQFQKIGHNKLQQKLMEISELKKRTTSKEDAFKRNLAVNIFFEILY